MQASLPKLVRMVSVEDFGQGSEAVRILGIKWLPLEPVSTNDVEDSEDNSKPHVKEGKEDALRNKTGNEMKGKEGNFINLEIAFAYKARPESRSMRKRAQCLHMYLAFYLPSGLKFRK